MCPLWPFHTLLMYGVLLVSLWLASCKVMAQVAEKAVLKGEAHLSPEALAEAFEVSQYLAKGNARMRPQTTS